MLNNNIAAGLSFNVDYLKSTNTTPGIEDDIIMRLGIVPFVRIHKTISENFKYYIEPKINVSFISLNKSFNERSFSIATEIGFLYFLSQKLSLELSIASISYENSRNKDTGYKYDSFYIIYNLVNPNIGIRYYF